MKNKIDFIKIMLSDGSIFHIDNSNILEYNCVTKAETVMDYTDIAPNKYINIPLVESLLLVIEDYTKIINEDSEEEFNPNRKDLAQILMCLEDGNMEIVYVDLPEDSDSNPKQTNCLSDNELYITIEDE